MAAKAYRILFTGVGPYQATQMVSADKLGDEKNLERLVKMGAIEALPDEVAVKVLLAEENPEFASHYEMTTGQPGGAPHAEEPFISVDDEPLVKPINQKKPAPAPAVYVSPPGAGVKPYTASTSVKE